MGVAWGASRRSSIGRLRQFADKREAWPAAGLVDAKKGLFHKVGGKAMMRLPFGLVITVAAIGLGLKIEVSVAHAVRKARAFRLAVGSETDGELSCASP